MFRLVYLCLPAVICTGLCQADQVTYLFTGDCSVAPETPNCVGTVSGSLVLQNYTQGDSLSAANFVQFTYNSNDVTIDSSDPATLSGVFSMFLPGTADMGIMSSYDFNTGASGDWALFASSEDQGNYGAWQVATTGGSSGGSGSSGAVPEPLQTVPLCILLAVMLWKGRPSQRLRLVRLRRNATLDIN
ncbi:MAG TPA: hypothetical protein VLW25_05150 [Bryobacteraceae bacterium]|nr:hypothetical protein [Bryobacteraceae bacterium]